MSIVSVELFNYTDIVIVIAESDTTTHRITQTKWDAISIERNKEST